MNKHTFSDASVDDFLNGIEHPARKADALQLRSLFADVTGWKAKMLGDSMIAFGSYTYTYKSGRSGTWLATGFSPRKTSLVIYIMPGYNDYSDILARLGKHKTGKSCLYINKLADINKDVLKEVISAGLTDLANEWPVTAT